MQDKHELYRKLLNECSFDEKDDVLWGAILYTRIWSAWESTLVNSIIEAVKSILFSSYEVKIKRLGSKTLLVRNCNDRKDYNEIWSNLKKCTDDYDFIEINRKRRFDNQILNNIKKYQHIKKNIPCNIIFKDRLYLSAWIMRIMRLQQIDLSTLDNKRIAIFFFDGDPIENYLCQKIKSKFPSCVTATLQHGQYVYKKDDYDINQTGIRNITADYIFAWGSFTEQQFIKAGIDSKRVIKLGNLLNPMVGSEESNPNEVKAKFGIICDAPTYYFAHEKNNEMINFANQFANMFDLQFWVKLHPSDSINNYTIDPNNQKCLGFYSKEKLMSDFVKDIDFALIHASSAYIDLLILNCKSFRYNSGIEFPLVDNPNDTFDSIEDLISKYIMWVTMDNVEKIEYINSNRNRYVELGNTHENYRNKIVELMRINLRD